MCFSAEASFSVGGLLLPVGAYCVTQAVRKRSHTLLLALIPVFFGLQQISEGFVWIAIHDHDHPENVRMPSLVFLFFALAFWPFWFPLVSTIMDHRPKMKRLFGMVTIASTFWFFGMFLPIALGPTSLLTTQVVQHSIQYYYPDLWISHYVPRTPLRILYFLMVALPMALGSDALGRIPGIALALSAVATVCLYNYAFVSVWCFFASVISIYLAWIHWQLPRAKYASPSVDHLS